MVDEGGEDGSSLVDGEVRPRGTQRAGGGVPVESAAAALRGDLREEPVATSLEVSLDGEPTSPVEEPFDVEVVVQLLELGLEGGDFVCMVNGPARLLRVSRLSLRSSANTLLKDCGGEGRHDWSR
jgi:hypothetical protein